MGGYTNDVRSDRLPTPTVDKKCLPLPLTPRKSAAKAIADRPDALDGYQKHIDRPRLSDRSHGVDSEQRGGNPQ